MQIFAPKPIDARATLRDAVKSAASEATSGNSGWRLLEGAGPIAAAASLPVGLILGLVGFAGSAIADRRSLTDARMPDAWMAELALAPDVSQVGLAFLARRLADRSFVSVQDALDFLDIEEAAEKTALADKSKADAAAQPQPGANALLERARKDCGEMLDPTIFDRAKGALKVIDKYTPDAKTLAKLVPDALSAVGRVVGRSK